MTQTIDVHDLPEEQVKYVREFVAFLRTKVKLKRQKSEKKEETRFAVWPLGVKGGLTRKEIYDYL